MNYSPALSSTIKKNFNFSESPKIKTKELDFDISNEKCKKINGNTKVFKNFNDSFFKIFLIEWKHTH